MNMLVLFFKLCLLLLSNIDVNADRLNSTSLGVSSLLNADTTVLRQLLNQETLIRMSVVKNVHNLMKDIVTLKDSFTTLQREVISIKQKSKDDKEFVLTEIEEIKRDIQLLNGTHEKFEESFRKQNTSILNLFEMLEKTKTEDQMFQSDMRSSLGEVKKNTSDELSDMKLQVRVLSSSLMRLSDHVQQQNRSFREDIENSYKATSDLIANVSVNVQEKSNKSLQDMMSELSETKQNQLRLSAAVLSLEWFRSNFSGGVYESKKQDTPVAFTAGITDSNRYWNSGTLVFPKVLQNSGGGYDSSTGIFTSPEEGSFVFYVTIMSYNSYSVDVDIVKNGVSKVQANTHSTYQTGTNMVALSLRKGDRVWVNFQSGKGYYSDSTPVISFTGFKI